MKIPEYNRQVGLNIAPRSGVSIKEPEIFRDTSSMERIGKQVLGTAEDMSNVYLDMKKERDNGIVNEFSNQFSMASNEKIRELQEQYKGANSEGIVDAYMEWQDDYIAKRTGFNQDTVEGELYLENDEQIKAAKDSLARSLPSTVNSLSSYVARELETYKKNQLEARVENLSLDAVSVEESSLQFKLNELYNVIDNQYEGQSSEFITSIKRKLDNNIYTSRLQNDSINNPMVTLVKVQDERYKKNVSPENIEKIKSNSLKQLKDILAKEMSQSISGASGSVINEDVYNAIKPVIQEYGEDKFWQEVNNEIATIRYDNEVKNRSNNRKIINDVFNNLFDVYDNTSLTEEEKENKFLNIIQPLVTNPNTSSIAEPLMTAFDDTKRYNAYVNTVAEYESLPDDVRAEAERIYGLTFDKRSKALEQLGQDTITKGKALKADSVEKAMTMIATIRGQEFTYSRTDTRKLIGAVNYIRNGQVSDLSFINALHPKDKQAALVELGKYFKYQDVKNRLLEQQIDLDKTIQSNYRVLSNLPNKEKISQLTLSLVKDDVVNSLSLHGEINNDMVNDVIRRSIVSAYKNDNANLVMDIDKLSLEQVKERKENDIDDIHDIYVNNIKNSAIVNRLNESGIEELASYIQIGDYNSAMILLSNSKEIIRDNRKTSYLQSARNLLANWRGQAELNKAIDEELNNISKK